MSDDAKQIDAGPDLASLVGDIVSAYVSNNPVPAAELPGLLFTVHAALTRLGAGTPPVEAPVDRPSTAEVRRSVTREGIVSFIDGRAYKTLKRHLTSHGLDPAGYRARYGLPADYPMVAASYAERRSALAKEIGLGRPGGLAESGRRTRSAA